MSRTTFLDGRVTLYAGDCLEVLAAMPENSVDSVVTDPPYHLTSIVKRFGAEGAIPAKDRDGAYLRAGAGFMGKAWDGGDIAFQPSTWAAVLRVLKPGGHLLSFSATRSYHRMACAIEDAGFEIRDQIGWCFGSGFPKSHDVSKGIDKRGPNKDYIAFPDFAKHYAERRKASGMTHAQICALGGFFGSVNHGGTSVNWEKGYALPTLAQWDVVAPVLMLDAQWKVRVAREEYEREVIGSRRVHKGVAFTSEGPDEVPVTLPGSEAARQWQGWGTALKPAWEPICVARKLLVGTVASNVLEHGTGALNIDGCRVGTDGARNNGRKVDSDIYGKMGPIERVDYGMGRWPANLIHDGSDEVLAAFPDTASGSRDEGDYGVMGYHGAAAGRMPGIVGDSGSAARFFYTAKADAGDRLGSKHPTVKPLDLMQYLCRLVTPPGGVILDPFAGTGTTGEAAWREGFSAILIEREAEYQADIARRMDLVLKPTQRSAVAKSKNKLMGAEGTPLFGGEAAE